MSVWLSLRGAFGCQAPQGTPDTPIRSTKAPGDVIFGAPIFRFCENFVGFVVLDQEAGARVVNHEEGGVVGDA